MAINKYVLLLVFVIAVTLLIVFWNNIFSKNPFDQELNKYNDVDFQTVVVSDLYIGICNSSHKVIAYDEQAAIAAGCEI